jgi:hypothetical protein
MPTKAPLIPHEVRIYGSPSARPCEDNRELDHEVIGRGADHLSEAVRELHQELASIETKIKDL